MGHTSCVEVCEVVSDMVCDCCPARLECEDGDVSGNSEYHDKLIECFTTKGRWTRTVETKRKNGLE